MLKGDLVNIIRIVPINKNKIDNIIKYISTENRILDFEKVISLPKDSQNIEKDRLNFWEQPVNSQIEAFKIENGEILLRLKTFLNPPLKILKQLSLFSDIEDIILSFSHISCKKQCGIYYIRRGGIVDKMLFQKESLEAEKFSKILYSQLLNEKEEELSFIS